MFFVVFVTLWPKSNSISISFQIRLRCTFLYVAFLSHTDEAIHNVSAYQLPEYYQTQRVPFSAWTVSNTWYIHCKQTRTNIAGLTQIYIYIYIIWQQNHCVIKRNKWVKSNILGVEENETPWFTSIFYLASLLLTLSFQPIFIYQNSIKFFFLL